MSRRIVVPPGLPPGPFTPDDVVGLVGRRGLTSQAYEHPLHGVYRVAGAGGGYADRLAEFRVGLTAEAVFGGLSAAWLHGLFDARASSPVTVVLSPHQRARARNGLVVRRDLLLPGEVVTTSLGPATSPLRTAFDLAREPVALSRYVPVLTPQLEAGFVLSPPPPGVASRLAWAVAKVDALLRIGGHTPQDLLELAGDHPGVRGLRVMRLVAVLADPRAESPPESYVRVMIALGGLPWPEVQYEILTRKGIFAVRADLAWPSLRLAGEYDGAHHDEDQAQVKHDRFRSNWVTAAQWRAVRFDVRHLRSPSLLLATAHEAIHP